jgi:aspartate/methionine/tyrosine aminotransferase
MIIEDDYDSEYRYAGRPVPALQGLDRHGSVFYTGSFGKALFPALRLGYMVVPENLVERVEAIKSITTRHAPVLEQAILHAFLTEGHFISGAMCGACGRFMQNASGAARRGREETGRIVDDYRCRSRPADCRVARCGY